MASPTRYRHPDVIAGADFRGMRRITYGPAWTSRSKLTQKVTKRRIARVDAENPLGDTAQSIRIGLKTCRSRWA
jgi:hypothetical protein